MKSLTGTADGLNSISDIFGDISKVTKGTDKAVFSVTSTLLSGTSQMITQIKAIQDAQKAAAATNIASSEGEALANGTKSAANAPWFMVIPLIATVVGTITGIFASLNSYASGGIIGGQTSIGDLNLARVNSGEMILNGTQQKKLFNLLNSNGGVAGSTGTTSTTVKIKGSDIYLALKNYDKSSANRKKI